MAIKQFCRPFPPDIEKLKKSRFLQIRLPVGHFPAPYGGNGTRFALNFHEHAGTLTPNNYLVLY